MKIIQHEQGSQAWLDYRKNKIGASDAGAILGISPYDSPYSLWMKKLGLSPDKQSTPAMERGKVLEIQARRMLEESKGHFLYQSIIESEQYPFLCSSMDGITRDSDFACEIKCLNIDDHDNGHVPEHYIPQLQHQMLCCDLQEITYVAYNPNSEKPFYTIVVKRDEAFLADYIPKAKAFYDCMRTFTAPELCPKDYRDMSQDADYRIAEAAYVNLSEEIEKLEKQKEQVKVKLLDISDGNNIQGAYTKMTHYLRKGAIAYDKIPELTQIDLEQYRKPVVSSVRITKV
jgi:putative phage-type endonuclease